jgi:hypothetical protein
MRMLSNRQGKKDRPTLELAWNLEIEEATLATVIKAGVLNATDSDWIYPT